MDHRLDQTNMPREASRPRDYCLVFLQEPAVFGISSEQSSASKVGYCGGALPAFVGLTRAAL